VWPVAFSNYIATSRNGGTKLAATATNACSAKAGVTAKKKNTKDSMNLFISDLQTFPLNGAFHRLLKPQLGPDLYDRTCMLIELPIDGLSTI
jgi:hypothetical protein